MYLKFIVIVYLRNLFLYGQIGSNIFHVVQLTSCLLEHFDCLINALTLKMCEVTNIFYNLAIMYDFQLNGAFFFNGIRLIF